MTLTDVLSAIRPFDTRAAAAAAARQDQLTKPTGALGLLEALSIRLAGIFGEPTPTPTGSAVIVAGADHGVASDQVSLYPAAVTAAMIANFVADTPFGVGGAAVNVLARSCGVDVYVADLGVDADLPAHPALVDAKIRRGTRNLRVEAAMTPDETVRAIEVGIDLANRAIDAGADLVIPGELGIGNTTAAADVTARMLGVPAEAVTGRGTGVDDAGLARKTAVVSEALARTSASDPLDVMAEFGGYELAAMTGMFLATAARGKAAILDGFVEGASALVAEALAPAVVDHLLPAGVCAEIGHAAQLRHFGLTPLFSLDLRLGEGTGGVVAVPIVRAAAAALREMRTFEEAEVPTS